MPPRHQALPPAQTSSAREAQKSFHCQLCSKGYSRMNDYEAHLGSYDHTHKQRLKDMKAMVRDPNAVARARKAEAKADAMVSIKVDQQPPAGAAAAAGGGFKKGGFKKSGFKSAFAPTAGSAAPPPVVNAPVAQESAGRPALPRSVEESDTEDEGYEMYDPRFPTE